MTVYDIKHDLFDSDMALTRSWASGYRSLLLSDTGLSLSQSQQLNRDCRFCVFLFCGLIVFLYRRPLPIATQLGSTLPYCDFAFGVFIYFLTHKKGSLWIVLPWACHRYVFLIGVREFGIFIDVYVL